MTPLKPGRDPILNGTPSLTPTLESEQRSRVVGRGIDPEFCDYVLDLAEAGVQCCNVHTNHVWNWRERYSLPHCCLFVCNPTCCCRPVVILAIRHHLTVHLWVEWCCNSSFSLVKRNLC